jgi:hypothetical protein
MVLPAEEGQNKNHNATVAIISLSLILNPYAFCLMPYALCLMFIQIEERERKLADLEPVMQNADRSFKKVASRGGFRV